jgi:hypothetical protein
MIHILDAIMRHSEENGYVGQTHFEVTGHKKPYEITLFSKKGEDWEYSLHFLHEPGSEEEILALEDELEENDELFGQLVEAAMKKVKE